MTGYPPKVVYGLFATAVILKGMQLFSTMARGCLELRLRRGVTVQMVQFWMQQTLPQLSFFHTQAQPSTSSQGEEEEEEDDFKPTEWTLQLDKDIPLRLRMLLSALHGLRYADEGVVVAMALEGDEGRALATSPFRLFYATLIVAAVVVACEQRGKQLGAAAERVDGSTKRWRWLRELTESWLWAGLPAPLRDSFRVDLAALLGEPVTWLWKEQQLGPKVAAEEVQLLLPTVKVEVDADSDWATLRPEFDATGDMHPSLFEERLFFIQRNMAVRVLVQKAAKVGSIEPSKLERCLLCWELFNPRAQDIGGLYLRVGEDLTGPENICISLHDITALTVEGSERAQMAARLTLVVKERGDSSSSSDSSSTYIIEPVDSTTDDPSPWVDIILAPLRALCNITLHRVQVTNETKQAREMQVRMRQLHEAAKQEQSEAEPTAAPSTSVASSSSSTHSRRRRKRGDEEGDVRRVNKLKEEQGNEDNEEEQEDEEEAEGEEAEEDEHAAQKAGERAGRLFARTAQVEAAAGEVAADAVDDELVLQQRGGVTKKRRVRGGRRAVALARRH